MFGQFENTGWKPISIENIREFAWKRKMTVYFPNDHKFYIYDVRDPENPKFIGFTEDRYRMLDICNFHIHEHPLK